MDRPHERTSPDIWILLLGAALVGRLVQSAMGFYHFARHMWPIFLEIFETEGLKALTDPGFLDSVLLFAIHVCVLLLLVWLFFLYLGRRRIFPGAFICVTLVLLAMSLYFFFSWYGHFKDRDDFLEIILQQLSAPVGMGVIWVPYLILSKRVKAVFVEPVQKHYGQRPSPPGSGPGGPSGRPPMVETVR